MASTTTLWEAAYADLLEWVPDLLWPTSVQTYGQMRTDPQLRSVLQAYSLPLRRASWNVDPTGCNPAVAAFVADNLGLTVAGDDSTRPRRGPIRFAEANRLAMLQLVFGHMPFVKAYDTSDGRTARLVRLAERMPNTIASIDLTEDDGLAGITQAARAGAHTTTPIPRSSLVWFAHEREGGAWQGRSLLRDSYGAWLMKRELWRVNATSLRRNGMGVPVVQAPPGATPGQVLEAQRLAQAHRVGDQAGVGLPAGFTLTLQGITGSVPDPLPFIQYLDQQMTRSALAGVVDLGNTSNGSRALGETFVDLLMLALQAVGDDMAETWTADVAADLVALNYGDDEPVPSVVCGSVGASKAVTAEVLNGLLASGALSASPELEAYVREQWKLPAVAQSEAPQRPSFAYDLDYGILTVNERRAQIGLDPVPDGDVLPVPATARTEPAAPAPVPSPAPIAAAAADAPTEWPFRRQLTDVEARSAVDPVTLQAQWSTAVDGAVDTWTAKHAPVVTAAILAAIGAAFDDGPEAVAAVTIDPPGTLTDDLVAEAVRVAEQAQEEQEREAKAQGVSLTGNPTLDLVALTAFGGAMAALLVRAWASGAARKAVQLMQGGVSKAAVLAGVSTHLDTLTDAQARDAASAVMSYGQGQGRASVLATAPEGTYTASEVMDAATCTACAAIDGTTFPTLEEADTAYASGGYSECQGGLRCRGIVVTTWS